MLETEVINQNGFYNGCCYGRGTKRTKSVSFTAPLKPGVYMLWHYFALQYNMIDAMEDKDTRKCFSSTGSLTDFVAWVEVIDGFKGNEKYMS